MTSKYTARKMFKDLKMFIAPYRARFIIGTFFRASSDLVWLFVPLAMGELVTFAANYSTGESITYLWKIFAFLTAGSFYHYIAHQLGKYLLYNIAEQVSLDSQIKSIKHMFALDTAWHLKDNSGNKLKKISKAGEYLNRVIRLYVNLLIESTINLIGIAIIFFTFSQQLVVFLVIFFITYYILSYCLTRQAGIQAHKVNVREEEFEGFKFEAINNISTIKSLGISDVVVSLARASAKSIREAVRLRIIRFRTRGVVLGLYQEAFRLVLVGFVVWQVFLGNFEVGIIAAVLLYFKKIE